MSGVCDRSWLPATNRQGWSDQEGSMNQLYLIVFLVFGVAIAPFAIQNSGEAVVKFIG
jgi:hypothetical protein